MGTATQDSGDEEAKVFLSYSRKDRERAAGVADALRARHFGVFKDTDDILPTEEWKTRLEELIEEADTIVFLLSPHSAVSEVCAWEVEYATALNKRIAPIVIDDVEGADIPPLLARLNFIFCTERDPFEDAVDTLASALSTDIEWIREHTRLAGLARRWAGAARPVRLLVRGQDIADAEGWRDRRPKDAPAVTADQAAFIAESRRAAGRRQRNWITGSLAIAAGAAALAIFAYFQSVEADEQRVVAEANAAEAAAQRDVAEEQRAAAEAAREEAIAERNAALLNESRFLAENSTRLLDEGRVAEALALAFAALPQGGDGVQRPLSSDALRALRQARLELREVTRLTGQGSILQAKFAPSGKAIATTDLSGGLALRATETGEIYLRMSGHDTQITDAAYAANGGFLFTGASDWTPRLWNAATGDLITNVPGLESIVYSVAVSPDMKRIAAGGINGAVAMWDLEAGQMVPFPARPPGGQVTQLAFTADNSVLVGLVERQVYLWDGRTGAQIAVIGGEESAITTFALRPLNDEIAIGLSNGDIEFRSTLDGGLIRAARGHHRFAIEALAFSSAGWDLASSDAIESAIKVFYVPDVRLKWTLSGHDGPVRHLSFSHDNGFLISGGADAEARVWKVHTGQQVATLGGHGLGVKGAAFSPTGTTAYTVAGDGTARIWSAPAPSAVNVLSKNGYSVVAAHAAENGTSIIVRETIAEKIASDGEVMATIEHGITALTGAVSADGMKFAAADRNGAIAIHDVESGALIDGATFADGVRFVDFAPDGGSITAGLLDGAIMRWAPGAEPELVFQGRGAVVAVQTDGARTAALHQAGLTIIDGVGGIVGQTSENFPVTFTGAIAPDLSRFATAGGDGQVMLRKPSGVVERTVSTPFTQFGMIAFSADGAHLFVSGLDNGLLIFDAETGATVASLSAHDQMVTAAATGLDETGATMLMSGDRFGQVLQRPLFLDAEAAIAEAGEILSRLRPLSRESRCRFFLAPAEACTEFAGR